MTQVVQPHTGATIKPGPMVTVVPDRAVTDDQLAQVAAGSGLNAPFVADQLSAWVTHQRMGGNLFRTLGTRTANPVYQAMYAALLASGTQAVATYEQLITELGGNPQYASPPARLQEGQDTKLIESLLLPGSADPLSLESAMLLAAHSALSLSVVFAETLAAFAASAKEGTARTAMETATETLRASLRGGLEQVRASLDATMSLQANHATGQKVMQGLEKATAAVKDALR